VATDQKEEEQPWIEVKRKTKANSKTTRATSSKTREGAT